MNTIAISMGKLIDEYYSNLYSIYVRNTAGIDAKLPINYAICGNRNDEPGMWFGFGEVKQRVEPKLNYVPGGFKSIRYLLGCD